MSGLRWQRESSPAGGTSLVLYDGLVAVGYVYRTGSRLETARWAWGLSTGSNTRGSASVQSLAKKYAEAAWGKEG